VKTGRWLLALGAVLLGLYSITGIVMAGSLQGTGYRIAVKIYLVLLAASTVLAVCALRWGRSERQGSRPAI
jgi:hypothetical protein